MLYDLYEIYDILTYGPPSCELCVGLCCQISNCTGHIQIWAFFVDGQAGPFLKIRPQVVQVYVFLAPITISGSKMFP
jgi:hypothetical protein